MIRTIAITAAALAAASAVPATAGELYGGVYKHAVDTPFTLNTNEEGVDLQLRQSRDNLPRQVDSPAVVARHRKRIATVAGAQDRAAQRQDAAHTLGRQRHDAGTAPAQ